MNDQSHDVAGHINFLEDWLENSRITVSQVELYAKQFGSGDDQIGDMSVDEWRHELETGIKEAEGVIQALSVEHELANPLNRQTDSDEAAEHRWALLKRWYEAHGFVYNTESGDFDKPSEGGETTNEQEPRTLHDEIIEQNDTQGTPKGLNQEEARLAGLDNDGLLEELALEGDLPDPLWIEVGLRLGVSGPGGIRAGAHGANTGSQAKRLDRFRAMWDGQPEFVDDSAEGYTAVTDEFLDLRLAKGGEDK